MPKGNPNPIQAHEACTSHGLYRYSNTTIEKWPPPMRAAYKDRCDEIMRLPHIVAEDAPAVAQAVRLEVVIVGPVYAWLGSRPLIDANGDYPKILHVLGVFENSLTRLYDKLGLNPDARLRMHLGGGLDITQEFAEVEDVEEEQDGKAEHKES